ncbi:hypothetical protein LRB11_14055 [Ectothiorhodospira haloalkaliphila]|uniref:hypothetical protein n=1 Tax=Ectothiorhodospira haloalkaliphila TaxID=421628 RepID=UPI001EE8BC7B|nr:hypothetical protein [Ectothiorhodospira haloalkaliphila]MCG5526044.1 hypothetical protein [Ectothiorhodospira haloalkaliphila]
MNIIGIAVDLAVLKERSMTDYTFPFWQAAILLTAVGLAFGLDPSLKVMVIAMLVFMFGLALLAMAVVIGLVFSGILPGGAA